MEVELKESQVKQAVEEYLQYQQNLGKLLFFRLNVGDILIKNKDDSHRLFRGCKTGTADIMVIQHGDVHLEYLGKQEGPSIPVAFVTFIECKATKGRQTPEQAEFEIQAHKMNCRYHIVRNLDELIEVLKRE